MNLRLIRNTILLPSRKLANEMDNMKAEWRIFNVKAGTKTNANNKIDKMFILKIVGNEKKKKKMKRNAKKF